jgi:chaperone modulatory protein CbpM
MVQFVSAEVERKIDFKELCYAVNTSEEFMAKMIEYCIATPVVGERKKDWLFNIETVGLVNKAMRINQDLAIDWSGIALVLNLLDQLDALRSENKSLKQQLNRFLLD